MYSGLCKETETYASMNYAYARRTYAAGDYLYCMDILYGLYCEGVYKQEYDAW
jgi:hypothetical protein